MDRRRSVVLKGIRRGLVITLERIIPPAYVVRVCPDAKPGESQPDFVAVATLEIDQHDSTRATMLGFHGTLTHADIHELIDKLREIGVETLIASRKDGHRLAYSKLIDGWYVVDVVALHKRMNRTTNNRPAP